MHNAPLFDDTRLDRALQRGGNALEAYRTALHEGGETLRRRFETGTPVTELVTGRARLVDQVLCHTWNRCIDPAAHDIALVAVGGYGRGELHPHSDIDLMILLEDGAREGYRGRLEEFLTLLWDIGLEVGHSVRSLDDCVREGALDITVATNLMEARLLAGPPALFEAMRKAVGPEHIWPSDRFFAAKWKEQQQRHRKFDDTAYKLEPNIKEGPGGLRDIQMIGWVAKRHFGAETLHDLIGHGFLTKAEYRALIDGQNFLWHLRFALHTLTRRREDRLLFDYQRTLAVQLGYQDGDHNLAVEQLMQHYYRTVMELGRLNEMLLQLFQEAILYADESGAPTVINKRFQSRRGFIEAAHGKVFEYQPFALLEIFLLLQQRPELKGVRAATIRLIRAGLHLIDDTFRADLRARSLFMEILRQPRGITGELRRMNRYGVLAAYLPAFARIVGRMQYDLFHVYTVDEHSLFVVRNLRRFTVPTFRHEFPLCSEIVQHIAKPELLNLSGLFHDIAKGRGGDHSELGAEEALQFCLRHGLSRFDAELVAWLIRNHLIMSMTAQRKDISDPDVIKEFAALVGNRMRLDHLYLLTVADIRATNPAMWNTWKDALLRELYGATKSALARGLERPFDQDEPVRETQRQARALLLHAGLSDEQIGAVWRIPTADYFLHHSAEEIAWHTEAISGSAPSKLPLILVKPLEQRGSTEIFIYGPDSPKLFALTTSALEQLGLNIVDARINTSPDGHTLDTFLVLEDTGEVIANPFRLNEIRETLQRRLGQPEMLDLAVSRRPSRQVRHFDVPTQISFEQDPHHPRTVMKVSTADRPGLLSRVGRAFAQFRINLQSARASTIGAQVEDVFYITDRHRQPLQDPQQLAELQRTIERLLAE